MLESRSRSPKVSTAAGHRWVAGPNLPAAQVFTTYQTAGRSTPGPAWAHFIARWNWAAILPQAVPCAAASHAPAVRDVPGGYLLSGHWYLPRGTETGPWLALPLAAPGSPIQNTPVVAPDILVLPARTIPRTAERGHAGDLPCLPGAGFRLVDKHVPAGLTSYSSGTPLRSQDITFLCAAVTGLALGTATRVTAELAGLDRSPGPAPVGSPGAVASELKALLYQERLAFVMEGVAGLGHGLRPLDPAAARERLAASVRRAAVVAQQVVASAYETALPFWLPDGRHPLESLVMDGAAVLQHLNATVDLLRMSAEVHSTKGEAP